LFLYLACSRDDPWLFLDVLVTKAPFGSPTIYRNQSLKFCMRFRQQTII